MDEYMNQAEELVREAKENAYREIYMEVENAKSVEEVKEIIKKLIAVKYSN